MFFYNANDGQAIDVQIIEFVTGLADVFAFNLLELWNNAFYIVGSLLSLTFHGSQPLLCYDPTLSLMRGAWLRVCCRRNSDHCLDGC